MNSKPLLETLEVDLDEMTAICKNGVLIKYARKTINDWLKQNTLWKGGWNVWFNNDDGESYIFTLTNPYKEMDDIYGEFAR